MKLKVKHAGLAAVIGLSMVLAPMASMAAGNRIALVPGGPHPYFAGWQPGIADAEKDFGVTVDYKVPEAWTLNDQSQLLSSLAAQGENAFGIFPSDAVGINSTLSEFKDNNIPSIAIAGCVQDPTAVDFCFSTDVYQAAYVGTKALIKAIGGKGNIVHLAGLLVDPNTTLREQAVQKAVDETNGAVKLIQTVGDTDDQEKGDQKINALLAAKKDQIDGLIATAYISSTVAATSLRNLGDKRIKLIGIDDDKIVLDGIKDGFVAGSVGQNPYGQAYVGSYALDLLASGCTPKADAAWVKTPQTARMIDSGTVLITGANVGTYKDDLKALSHKMQATFKADYLTCK
jgi:ribose transport system substrate-binding protein